MTPMAPTRPTRIASPALAGTQSLVAQPPLSCPQCRIPLMADLAAASAARTVVEDVIRAWRVPVDSDVAILLTSELVTNAVTHGTPPAGTFVLLTITCDASGLRVDVHDGSGDLPVLDETALDKTGGDEVEAEAETGRGLLLVTALSAEWGFYRTSGGKAVYFTLDFPRGERPEPVPAADGAGNSSGEGRTGRPG